VAGRVQDISFVSEERRIELGVIPVKKLTGAEDQTHA